jgi:putative glutamine amidotransferase
MYKQFTTQFLPFDTIRLMRAPLIGITIHPQTAPDREELDILLEGAVNGVERAGGLPLLIPLGLQNETLRKLYSQIDGLLLTGGGDIHPERYGAVLTSHIDGVDAERDRTEFALVDMLVEDDKPFFGICRGTQVVNVGMGGTLYRDVSEHPNAIKHTYYPDLPNDLRPHEIKIEEDSLLAKVIGQPVLFVNSLHHQAIKDVATGLRITAVAPDGMIEAIEAPERTFGLGVQWHPESLLDAPEMMALFEAFVEASAAVINAAAL